MKKNKNICIVVLNYNTWQLTIKMIEGLKKVNSVNEATIVVVDNFSSNRSYEELYNWNAERNEIILLHANENRGYAAGNNIGMRWAYEHDFNYIWIVNNDILFPDCCVLEKMVEIIMNNCDAGAVSPRVLMPNGEEVNRHLFRTNTFLKVLFTPIFGFLNYICLRLQYQKERCIQTYRPQGCCMLIDAKKAAECEYFDEHTFLYCEEPIFAERLLKSGYNCYCAINTEVVHNHGRTIGKYIEGKRLKQIQESSREYLWSTYYHMSKPQVIICRKVLAAVQKVRDLRALRAEEKSK